VELRKKVWCTN